MVDEDAAHHPRGNGEEMGAVAPIVLPDAGQTEIRLVRELGGLERMPRTLMAEMRARQAPQLGMNHRHQLVERLRVAITDTLEEPRDLVRGARLVVARDAVVRFSLARRAVLASLALRTWGRAAEPVTHQEANIGTVSTRPDWRFAYRARYGFEA